MKTIKYILLLAAMAGVCLLPAAAAGTEAASPAEISAESPAMDAVTAVDLSAVPSGETLCLEQSGVYRLTGALSGQIAVDTDGAVTLILAGVSVVGQECLFLDGDGTVTLWTETGTVNTLDDGSSSPDSHASSVIFSKCPLTVDGDGVLIVTAGANNGLQAKRGLTVSGGTLQISAANSGIKTDGPLSVTGGSLALTCGGDGLAADTGRLASGDITVSGGSVVIDAQGRGLDAEGTVTVSGGTLNICSAEDGIRSGETVLLSGGEMLITVSAQQTVEADADPVTGDGIQGTAVTVSGGTLNIDASDEGIQADSLLTVSGGELTVRAAGNGLSCEGSVLIADGSLTLVSQGDAVQGVSGVTVSGGQLDITTGEGAGQAINRSDSGGFGGPGGWGGGSSRYTMPAESMKGIKSDGDIVFSGGTVVLNCVDDSVHAGGSVSVSDTDMTVSSNDDAIHADGDITVDSGRILVLDCFEGIEGKIITFNGGDTDIYSVNDGVNATSGAGGWGGPWGSSDCAFIMNGGSLDIYITGTTSNLGDGVDSNGSLIVNGGWLTSSTLGGTMENGLDSGGSFVVNGGIVASGGNSGMQESASSSSEQCTAVLSLSNKYVAAGTECVVTDAEGRELICWTPYNGCNCLIFSHPDFVIGGTYTLTAGSLTMDFTFDSVSYSNSGHSGWGRFPF